MRKPGVLMMCLALAATLLACALPPRAARGPATPSPQRPGTPADAVAVPALPGAATPRPETAAPGPAPTAVRAAAPAEHRLPAVLAQVSFAPAGGDAYCPMDLALDEAGRAVVLCLGHDASQPGHTALVVIDLRRGVRGPFLPLPLDMAEQIAVTQGRAYVRYQRHTGSEHLAAVELETGRVVADVALGEDYCESLLADPAGRLYLLMQSGLEVRDAATLALLRRLPCRPSAMGECLAPIEWLAIDPTGERLYAATRYQLRAYRTADLSLLWEALQLSLGYLDLVADAAGRYVYAWYRDPESQSMPSRLVAYEAESGRLVQDLQFPIDPQAACPRMRHPYDWRLLWADSQQGRLLFCRSEQGYPQQRVLWTTGPDGQQVLAESVVGGGRLDLAVSDGRVLAVSREHHQASILDLADLRPLAQVILGVKVRGAIADPGQGRLYVNDSAGRLHVLDARDYRPVASLQAGRGDLTLDAANHLLFVPREPQGPEVAVVDTAAITVTGVITGGHMVAVDSAGRRAFVGSYLSLAREIQVWDTRTFRLLASIPFWGPLAYNPLRDELYLRQPDARYPAASIVDGKSLTVTGQLRFDSPSEWTIPDSINEGDYRGLEAVDVTVDLRCEVVTARLSLRGEDGFLPEWRALSARTLAPLTHTVTLQSQPNGRGLVVLPADDGRVYTRACKVYHGGTSKCETTVWRAGTEEVIDRRKDVCLDLCLPGTGVGLMYVDGTWQAFDLRTWAPLGSLPDPGIQRFDPLSHRLYAWEGSTLTVLGY